MLGHFKKFKQYYELTKAISPVPKRRTHNVKRTARRAGRAWGPRPPIRFISASSTAPRPTRDQEHLRALILELTPKIPDRTAGHPRHRGAGRGGVCRICWPTPGCWRGRAARSWPSPATPLTTLPDRLQAAACGVPILHMIRETVKTIQAMGKQTVGILATDGTVQTGIYQNELTAAGLTPVTLPEAAAKDWSCPSSTMRSRKGRPAPARNSGRSTAYLRSVGLRLRHSGLHGAVGLPHPPQPAPLLYRRHGDLGRAGHPPLRQTTAERIRKSLPPRGRLYERTIKNYGSYPLPPGGVHSAAPAEKPSAGFLRRTPHQRGGAGQLRLPRCDPRHPVHLQGRPFQA